MSEVRHKVMAAGGPGAAIATICLGVALMGMSDMLAKNLAADHNPFQIVMVRNLIALPLVVALVWWRGGPQAFATPTPWLHALRGVLLLGAGYTFFTGLRTLGLAEATAIGFAAPIFITLLSAIVLGEAVGWRRWLAVLAGFVGVLVIVRPGAEAFQPASLYVIGTAVFYAVFMISSRWIHSDESLWTMMFWNNVFPALFAAPFVPFVWTPIPELHWQLLAGMAVLAAFGVPLIAQAFRMAPASVVAPFDYTILLWACLWGWLIWGELPDEWTWVGAAVIVVSGVYIVFREARVGAPPSHPVRASVGGGDVVEQRVDAGDG